MFLSIASACQEASIEQVAYFKASNTASEYLADFDYFGSAVALFGDTLVVAAVREASGASGVGGDQDDNGAPASGAVYVFRHGDEGWSQEAYLKASNTGAYDGFGTALALVDDTLVVGAPGEDSSARGIGGEQDDNGAPDSGAVYVFHRSDAGWSQEAYLKASRGDAGDRFGAAVAISGDRLVVGAAEEARGVGAAYVFHRSGRAWTQEAHLKATRVDVRAPPTACGLLGDGDFGTAVALLGDRLAVAAPQCARAGSDRLEAGVYLFRRAGDGWELETFVGGPYSVVALSEDTLVAAATDQVDPSDVVAPAGAVHVYRKTGRTWSREAALEAPDSGALGGDRFGSALAISGDLLAVGAHEEDSSAAGIDGNSKDDSATGSGAVYVFRRDGQSWSQRAYVKASNAEARDRFGFAVALWDDALLVGAPRESSGATGIDGDQADNSVGFSGAAYRFE